MEKHTVVRLYLIGVMLVLSFISYKAFTEPVPTRKPDEQTLLSSQIPEAKPGPPPTVTSVAEGEALVLMEIPRFGENWKWTALEGTDENTLAKGPGHFTDTALPGEDGNSAWAAHRATHGDPFLDFDTLEIGDIVVLSQLGAVWTYEIRTEPKIIAPDAQWVLDEFSEGKWLTLTTCWPKYGSEKRMYVRAELISVE